MCNFAAQSANIPYCSTIMTKTIFDAQEAAQRRLESFTGNVRTWIAVDAETCKSVAFSDINFARSMPNCYIFRAVRLSENENVELVAKHD